MDPLYASPFVTDDNFLQDPEATLTTENCSILLRLKFKLRWPRKLGLIEWRITSSFPSQNWKKKTINFSNRIFYACYEKIPDASSIYHWSCLLSGQSVTIKCVTFFFSASLLNWKFEKGSSHELINSFCLRSGFRRDSFIISDDDSWCLSAQLLFKLLKDLISTCFFSKLKVRWRPASKNQFWFKVIHG